MSEQKSSSAATQVNTVDHHVNDETQWRIDNAKRRYCFRKESIPEGAEKVIAVWAFPYDGCHQCSWDERHDCAFGWSFIPPKDWQGPITYFEMVICGGDERRGQRLYSDYMELYADEFTDEEYDAQMNEEQKERWDEIDRREKEAEEDRRIDEEIRFNEWWEREGKFLEQLEKDRLKYEIDSDLESTEEETEDDDY